MSAGTQTKTGLALLREPFPDHQISVLPKPYSKDSPKGKCNECGGYHGLPAVHLSYVGHAALTDRLLDADPNWHWEPLALDKDGLPMLDSIGGMWIKLTVCGVTRFGYGDAQGKTGNNATKERIGDALRNAAMRFGCALELWHKGDLHGVDDDDERTALPPPPSTNGHGNGKPQATEHWKHFRSDCDKLIREFPNVYPDWNAVVEHGQFVLRGKNIDPELFPDWFATKADGDKLTRMMEALELRTQTAPEALPIGEIPF